MAGPRTVYVNDANEPTWLAAQAIADKKGMSMAEYVIAAVKEKVTRDQPPKEASDEIVVEVTDREGSWRKQRFSGHWLVRPSEYRHSVVLGAAKTAKGNIALYVHDQNRDEAFVKSLPTFDELVEEGLDPEFVAEVGAEMGEEYIEDLEI